MQPHSQELGQASVGPGDMGFVDSNNLSYGSDRKSSREQIWEDPTAYTASLGSQAGTT